MYGKSELYFSLLLSLLTAGKKVCVLLSSNHKTTFIFSFSEKTNDFPVLIWIWLKSERWLLNVDYLEEISPFISHTTVNIIKWWLSASTFFSRPVICFYAIEHQSQVFILKRNILNVICSWYIRGPFSTFQKRSIEKLWNFNFSYEYRNTFFEGQHK